MSTPYATTSTFAVKSRRQALRAILLVSLAQPWSYTFGQQTSHVTVTPSFRWPTSLQSMAAANRAPKAQIEAFYKAIRAQTAGGAAGSIPLSQFRFALLGPDKVCLATAGGDRFPWFLAITCPAHNGFDDTTLLDERMDLLVTDLLDLDGDGFDEVISSEFAAGYTGDASPPIYWYTIYSFKDGLPHDVSSQFRDFYDTEVLRWLARLERLVLPPLGSGSERNDYLEAQIVFTRLKYERKILGQPEAGLVEAREWADSPNANMQQLAVLTLQEINDPASIEELRKLTTSKYQGVCRSAVGGIAHFEHRNVTGQELESMCKAPGH
jgi:hypothetical protein